MVVIPQNVIVIPGRPQKHAEDYMRMCTIIAMVQAIFPYKCTFMSDMSTYIGTSSPIANCFPKSTVAN